MRDPILLSTIAIFGICLGSFVNVLIYRLPRRMSLVTPASHCPNCGKRIRFFDNVPVLSFLILGGRCRACRSRISFRYPMVELLAGLVTVLPFYFLGFGVKAMEAAGLSLIFIAVFFIDLDHRIIPDVFTLPGMAIGLGLSFVPGALVNWKDSATGLALGGGTFFLIGLLGRFLFRKEAMGLGDVKFAAMMGAFLGWKNLLLILVMASFFGSLVGLAIMAFSTKTQRSSYVPFGPFLVVAAWLAIYFGQALIKTYLDFIRP